MNRTSSQLKRFPLECVPSVFAMAAVWFCTAALSEVKVSWSGETFLDVIYKKVGGQQLKTREKKD